MNLFLIDSKMKNIKIEIISPKYGIKMRVSSFPETVLINKSLKNVFFVVSLRSTIISILDVNLEAGTLSNITQIEEENDLKTILDFIDSKLTHSLLKKMEILFKKVNLLKNFIVRKTDYHNLSEDSTEFLAESELSELEINTKLFTIKKIGTWPSIDKIIVKTSEYLDLIIKKSFLNRILAYMTTLGDSVYIKELKTQKIVKEKMPSVSKVLLSLLYKSEIHNGLIANKIIKHLTITVGKKFDSPMSVYSIKKFISMYNINMDECEETVFNSFNEFFYRKLKQGARKIEKPGFISSPADCRMLASKNNEILVKGRYFEIKELICKDIKYQNICICRLAPEDYHRFHTPLSCKVVSINKIEGQYQSVSPVNKVNRVLDQNTRTVIELSVERGTIYFVAIGAMLVGSVVVTVKPGDMLNQMDELGYFQFGGSCVVMISDFAWEINEEIKSNSLSKIETLVKVGNCIEINK